MFDELFMGTRRWKTITKGSLVEGNELNDDDNMIEDMSTAASGTSSTMIIDTINRDSLQTIP